MKYLLFKKLIRVEWLPATGGAWRAERGNLITSVLSEILLICLIRSVTGCETESISA